jgi:putative membrane protein
LIIKKGWLKKETIVVPLQKIQTVHIEESALHKILGIVKISVDTAGSSKTEVTIDALRRPMAEALQAQLNNRQEGVEEDSAVVQQPSLPIITLGTKDLLKLSLSANHLEAFAILLSFGYTIYDSIKSISEGLLTTATGLFPRNSVFIFVVLFAAVLCITIFISTIRIFLKFYNFSVARRPSGFYIKSGLTNVKEQLVSFKKIQFVSWRASWLRKKIGLWLLEYKIAGGNEVKTKMRVEVPVTRYSYINDLVNEYYGVPAVESLVPVRIHPSYVLRRILIAGLLPALVLMAGTWLWWEENAFVFVVIPLLVGMNAFLLQKRFRAFACTDVVYIDRSVYGTQMILLKWYKLQTVSLQQSISQRRKQLATVKLHTASGNITLPYIPLGAAREIVNYALYQIETTALNQVPVQVQMSSNTTEKEQVPNANV